MSVNYEKMARRVEIATGSVVFANLHDYMPIKTGKEDTEFADMYKVIVSFSAQGSREAKSMALSSLFENQASPIENSFRPIPGVQNAFVGFMVRNREVREYETETASKMKVMAANLLMDESDQSLWELSSGKSGSRFLTRHNEENLEDLIPMAAMKVQNRRPGMPIVASITIPDMQESEFVAYVDKETATVRYGHVISVMGPDSQDYGVDDEGMSGMMEVVDAEDVDRVKVDPELIVESAFLDLTKTKEFAAVEAPATKNPASMEAYYKQVYGYDAAYWNEFKAILNSHAAV